MGSAKREMERQHSATMVGIEIGIRAGVLERCEIHEETYWTTGDDEREAYRIASAMVRDGDPLVANMDRQEVLDGVKAAIDDAGDECGSCAKNRDSD